MKLLVANIAGVEQGSAAAEFVRTVLVPLTRRNAATVLGGDDSLVFRFASQGSTHPAFVDYPHLSTANPTALNEMARQGRSEGFDAVIFGCFGDPLLWTSRAEVDLPIAGFGESAILAAAVTGRRIGVVSSSALLVEPIAAQLAGYGLGERLVGVSPIGEPGPEQERAMADSRALIPRFRDVARGLISQGAEVLIPACGLMSPALRLAPGAESEFPDGLTDVDGVPIVDIVAASVVSALSMARARLARQAEVGSAPPEPEDAWRNPVMWDVV